MLSLDKSSYQIHFSLNYELSPPTTQPKQRMPPPIFSKFSWASAGLQYKYGRHTMMRRMAYHSNGATPLLLAISCGNYEAAAKLLHEGRGVEAFNMGI